MSNSLSQSLDVSFEDKSLLSLAFVHSSYLNEHPGSFLESNERLEFLGDALVGLVIANEIYRRYPNSPEGVLTTLRSKLVRGETLAEVADSLRLGQRLFLGRGEEASGGRHRPSNLAAVFEAFVGAIFLDRGFETARDFVLGALSEQLSDTCDTEDAENPKAVLQEVVQALGQTPPSYRIANVTGEDHARLFTAEVMVEGEIMGRGVGRRKSLAEQEAARRALREMAKQS